MLKLNGYQILTQIYESANSAVYRGIRQKDNQPVILKMIKQDYPTPEELTRYKQEYEITRNLNLEGVVKAYSLEEYQRTIVLILEDFGGHSLKMVMDTFSARQGIAFLEKFFQIAIQIADILGRIHAANVIHKDINPANIVINLETEQVKIIDFGISTVLTRENPTLKNPNVLEGTLAYISPEQTGRMNRVLDYRTDFYSVGATFYELLTGKLPFETSDALDLVHCHIAKQPVTPHQFISEIPLVVSDIVMKLMAKTAEERYQNAFGLKADLERCFNQLQTTGQIAPFLLGIHDISNKFQLPQKLYGRTTEIAALLTAFERVASGAQVEMMLVVGYSGIGKSALVQELYKPITKARGYFISGKFDQFQRNIPYSAVVAAFAELVRQLLTETETQLTQWRTKLLKALGFNGQVIIDVIPEVELIVGKQPAVPELGPTESQNRFNWVFQNFIRAFCSKEHPLVIFIDDLQWAEVASLKLIKLLMSSPNSEYLFFLGAYRDNEVNPSHPLMLTINEIREAGIKIEYISLSPLDLFHVNQLISDTLKCSPNQTLALAELVLLKTDGNPFFVQEFLKSLYAENLLKFDFTSLTNNGIQGSWQWDLEQIKSQGITDNVVDLMASNLQKLSSATQRVLQLSAAIGNQFDLQTLAIVYQQHQKQTIADLQEAIAINLIMPLSDAYKAIDVDITGHFSLEINQQPTTIEYKFAHDRIQQAAYSLIPPEDKQAVHWKIGQLLLQNTPQQAREQQIFDIVNQLNFGIELITTESERTQLAQLNLIAGKKAKASTAYESAWNYLKIGMNCLSVDSWQNQYELTLALYVETAEAASLSGNFEDMEKLTSVVMQQGKTLLDKIKVYEIKIQSYRSASSPLEALETGLSVLKMLGIRFPKKPNTLDIILALLRTNFSLVGKRVKDLIHLPEMTDPDKIAAIQMLSNIISASYIAVPELFPLIVSKQVELSVKYGNNFASPYAYSTYGFLLCGIDFLKDVNSGYQFGQLALRLLDKFNAIKFKSKTSFTVNFFIRHWQEHLKETLTPFRDAYLIGLENGDLEYASYSASAYCYYSILVGKELTQLEGEMAMYNNAFKQFNQETLLHYNQLHQQLVLNLMDQAEDKCLLIGEIYDERKMLPLHLQAKIYNVCYGFFFCKLYLCYIFQNYQQARESAALVEKYIKGAFGAVPVSQFYNSLTQLAIYFDVSQSEQKQILKKVEFYQKKLKRWATSAPMNHLQKFYLVEAERYRVLGHQDKAIDYYDRAIALAKEHEYINDEALAHELAGKFYLALGKVKIAQVYMLDARYCYRKWGAIAKVKDLEARYPQLLFNKFDSQVFTELSLSESNASTQISAVLDLATVIKASQAIGSEIVLEQLLQTLMKILIANAGAQVGYLILETQGQLFIEAEGAVDTDNFTVLQSIPVENRLPTSIINYVVRTCESIVLNDATQSGNFTNDLYIQNNQPKSILCVPLLDRGKLVSIIYLENNLTTGAFTPDRLEVLKILSAQAAISIENARLYQTLEDKVKERTAQLAQANQEIIGLNKRLKAENLRMSAELEVTKQLQQMILPKPEELELIEGLELAGFMEPADEVGGDYYDVLQLDGKVKIGIGDVTGHGLESGMLMLMTQTAVRTLLESNQTDPVQFLDILNRTIYGNVQRINPHKNLTLAILDYANGTITISGQHEDIIVVRVGGQVELIDTKYLGFPIGLDEEIADLIASEQVQLNPGDVVVLYTDGITEAFDINRQEYGLKQLCEIVRINCSLSPQEIRQAVIEDVRRHIGEQKVFDDITLVVMKQK